MADPAIATLFRGRTHMTRTTDADGVLKAAQPLVHQQAPELQPYGHTIRMPIALSENVCKESVESLNQLLAEHGSWLNILCVFR
jgi:hypothetical protein